ncbi:hypothetical protein BURPS668_2889 [Burkholderia pseudomallei 668]|nr:hypothetical protein BURPS668_2889 [Burkholderia pseudomallei 668]
MFRKLSSPLAGNCRFFEVRTFHWPFCVFLCARRSAGVRRMRARFAILI